MDVGCVQCHGFRGEALPGVVGVDLADTTRRIRAEWFRQFLLNPTELKPRTRMPSFFPGGKSQNADVLEGDPERQIAAIWAYLAAGSVQPLPAKIEAVRRQDFELRPTERPIVLRTFMPVAGTHAIAVGLPAGVHFAFDSSRLRLAQAWRGRFLDAQGTWFSRFTPPASPLGNDVITPSAGRTFAWLKSADQPWPSGVDAPQGDRFLGYRLDAEGQPTFLYQIGPTRIEDRITAEGDRGLRRRLQVTLPNGAAPEGATLWLRAHTGPSLNVTDRQCVAPDGLTVRLDESTSAELRQVGGQTEWMVPIAIDEQPANIEVRYQW
jgi:hypothetical protein